MFVKGAYWHCSSWEWRLSGGRSTENSVKTPFLSKHPVTDLPPKLRSSKVREILGRSQEE